MSITIRNKKMKRVFYIFIFLISILFVFSCSSSMRSINAHLSDKGLLAFYQKETDNAQWSKKYYYRYPTDYFTRPVFKKGDCKYLYLLDTIHIENYSVVEYCNITFVGPEEKLINNVKHLDFDVLFDKDVYICGTGMWQFRNGTLFPDESGEYVKNDSNLYRLDILAGNVKSKNPTFMRFYKEPKYFVLGLIEWGYFLDMNYTLSNKARKKLYKKQASKLGNYYRVVFPMYK